VHSGKQLSFVYDIADLYKVEQVIPLAFRVAKACPPKLEREVRMECRRQFKASRLMERILPDIAKVLDVSVASEEAMADEYAADESRPAEWWQPASIPADLPIGQILKLPTVTAGLEGDMRHDRADPGAGNAVTAG
jgi:CRISPR-associated protein Cas1